MRNLYIGLSILCFSLSGVITFKALNLPEKDTLNPTAPSQVKSYKFSSVTKEVATESAIDQEPPNPSFKTLKNPTPQLEQKPADKNTVSQANIQARENTIKQLEQKPIVEDNSSKAYRPSVKDTIAQQEYTPEPIKNVSQHELSANEPEKTKNISTVLLGDIAFKFGQIQLDENMIKFIEQSTQHILTFLPNCRVIVEGHADNGGAEEYNMDLSYFRAKAVALEFEKQGISFKHISVIGYGDTRPIASNDTAEGRAKNRRVVVRLIPEKKGL